MRNELLALRILVVLLLFFTLISLILNIWIYAKQGMLQTQMEGILNTQTEHWQLSIVVMHKLSTFWKQSLCDMTLFVQHEQSQHG